MAKNPRLWVTVPEQYVKAINDLVEKRTYLNRGDAMRSALRLLFRRHEVKIYYGECGI